MSQRLPPADPPRNVVLVGLSCTGKSTVGRLLAERLGWPFVDTDAELERRAGKSVARIFAEDGEAAFRQLEREVVATVCAGRQQVIATGGGAVVDPQNRALLREGNWVVWLDAPPETILARLRRAAGREPRPLLAGDDPLGKLRAMRAERETYYAQANAIFRTDQVHPSRVAARIHADLKRMLHAANRAG